MHLVVANPTKPKTRARKQKTNHAVKVNQQKHGQGVVMWQEYKQRIVEEWCFILHKVFSPSLCTFFLLCICLMCMCLMCVCVLCRRVCVCRWCSAIYGSFACCYTDTGSYRFALDLSSTSSLLCLLWLCVFVLFSALTAFITHKRFLFSRLCSYTYLCICFFFPFVSILCEASTGFIWRSGHSIGSISIISSSISFL